MSPHAHLISSLLLVLSLQTASTLAAGGDILDQHQAVLLTPPVTAAPSLAADTVAKHVELSMDGYTYHGCWTDTRSSRMTAAVRSIGPGRFTTDDSMTTSRCISYCTGPDIKSHSAMRYAALLEGHTCHCSTSISPFFSRLAELSDVSGKETRTNSSPRCMTPCAGAPSEACGGTGALTVYRLSDDKGGPFWEEERFTTTTITRTTTTQRLEDAESEDGGEQQQQQQVAAVQEEEQTGIAWSQYAGPSTWYGILAAITFAIAAVV